MRDASRVLKARGFTLLEILVVIIIVGALAGVAMPMLFKNVERSRGAEALTTLGLIKRAIDACSMQFAQDPSYCNDFDKIGMTDPSGSAGAAGAHFNYNIVNVARSWATGSPLPQMTLQATRNTLDNGTAGDNIVLDLSDGVIFYAGTGAFSGIRN
jgi:prepilin-type N-terminal cleavage/methylation domain-containing protein